MTNIFKTNSRFSSLIDDFSEENHSKKESKKGEKKEPDERSNLFKSERPLRRVYGYTGFRDRDRDRERYRLEREIEIKAQKELEEREKAKKIEESLKIENFPDLVSNPKKENNEVNMKMNYMEKINKEDDKEIKNVDKDLENFNPGWVLLKREPVTGITITKTYPKIDIEENKVEKSHHEMGMDIINILVELHEKRKYEYIENYGYDEWERMFKFIDWREREAYLEEMEEMEEMEEIEYEDDDYE